MESAVTTLDELRTWTLERSLPHEQLTIWKALTEPEQLAQWSSVEIDGTRSLGAPILVRRRGGPPRSGMIQSFLRPRLFGYTTEGRGTAWEIVAEPPGGSRLRLVASLDANDPGPQDHAEWDECRRDLVEQMDALEDYLAARVV